MLVPLAILGVILIVGGVWLIRQDARRLGAPELITWGGLAILIVFANIALELIFPTGSIDGWALVAAVESVTVFIGVLALWLTAAIVSIRGTRSNRPQKLLASFLGVAVFAALVIFHIAFYRIDTAIAIALMTLLAPLTVPAATLITLLWWPKVQQWLFRRRCEPVSAVIVLGGGLRSDGTPTNLLARRIDAGIRVLGDAEPAAPIVMTGGQGHDEIMPEAESMQRYALERGVEEARIIPEGESTNTLTNLRNARALLVRRGIEKNVAVVTSEYHVPRAANTMRQVPLEGIASPSATHPFYKPAAYLRETLAILWQRRTMTLIFAAASLFPGIYALLAALG